MASRYQNQRAALPGTRVRTEAFTFEALEVMALSPLVGTTPHLSPVQTPIVAPQPLSPVASVHSLNLDDVEPVVAPEHPDDPLPTSSGNTDNARPGRPELNIRPPPPLGPAMPEGLEVRTLTARLHVLEEQIRARQEWERRAEVDFQRFVVASNDALFDRVLLAIGPVVTQAVAAALGGVPLPQPSEVQRPSGGSGAPHVIPVHLPSVSHNVSTELTEWR